jgi:hypothetical protein
MPRYAPNKMPQGTKRKYFELIRSGVRGAEAARRVGASLSCGSVWFVDAGQVSFVDKPISSRYLSQDDRIEIADGIARREPATVIGSWSVDDLADDVSGTTTGAISDVGAYEHRRTGTYSDNNVTCRSWSALVRNVGRDDVRAGSPPWLSTTTTPTSASPAALEVNVRVDRAGKLAQYPGRRPPAARP